VGESAAVLKLVEKGAGSGAHDAFKGAVHVALVGEAGLRGDVAKGIGTVGDHSARSLYTKILQIFAGSAPGVAAEDARGVHRMNPGGLGEIFDPQRLAEIFVDFFPHDAPARRFVGRGK